MNVERPCTSSCVLFLLTLVCAVTLKAAGRPTERRQTFTLWLWSKQDKWPKQDELLVVWKNGVAFKAKDQSWRIKSDPSTGKRFPFHSPPHTHCSVKSVRGGMSILGSYELTFFALYFYLKINNNLSTNSISILYFIVMCFLVFFHCKCIETLFSWWAN